VEICALIATINSRENMTDYLAFIIQGFCNGLGFGVSGAIGLWFYEKYIKSKLEMGHQHMETVKRIVGGGKL
jgi:hypothetical protein